MDEIKKILVIGGPGSGKSFLASNLGQKLNLPVYHLDSIHIEYDVIKNGKKKRNDQILKILNNDTWIMDGNYRGTLKERIDACDIIIFLDYPTYKLVSGVLIRFLKKYCSKDKMNLKRNKVFDLSVISLAYNWRKKKRGDIVNILNSTDKTKYIFKNRSKLNDWFEKTFKEKIRSY